MELIKVESDCTFFSARPYRCTEWMHCHQAIKLWCRHYFLICNCWIGFNIDYVSLKSSNFLKEQLVEKFKLLVELKRNSFYSNNYTRLKNVLWIIQKWNKMAELQQGLPRQHCSRLQNLPGSNFTPNFCVENIIFRLKHCLNRSHYSKLKHLEDLVVLRPLKYCFSTHVALNSVSTEENETEEMNCGKTWIRYLFHTQGIPIILLLYNSVRHQQLTQERQKFALHHGKMSTNKCCAGPCNTK